MEINAYLRYCGADSPYFEVPTLDGGRFEQADAEPPAGWQRRTDVEWVNLLAPGPLPEQGWKVHLTATPGNAAKVLQDCWDYCTGRAISFKFLRSLEALHQRSSKYADRTASGKFVTVYTRDEDELASVVADLEARLGGTPGPGILSDVRWGEGPLHLRFGGFAHRETRTADGRLVPAVEDPDGRLVPDERRPGFHPPPWAPLPPVVEQAVAARAAGRLTDFPYRPVRALHFSNGGGVYVARTPDGGEVLLKEARPYAGLDGVGDDAVARLEREAWAYETLADVAEVPALVELRVGHEHHFLARELVDGEPLASLARREHPLTTAGATPERHAAYAAWALDVVERIDAGLHAMHERGVVFADLQPSNVLVRADGSISFIDFEGARRADDERPLSLGTPGYMAPWAFRGPEIDHYSLAVLALDLLVPLARLVAWDETKARDLLAFARRHFPLPDTFEDWVLSRLRFDLPRTPPEEAAERDWPVRPTSWPAYDEGRTAPWSQIADALSEGILAAATPERADRLYPGDARQLVDPAGGVTFAHGAAGVLWTLERTGTAIPDRHRAWFRDTVRSVSWERPGFHDGLAGAALTLGTLGEHDAARAAMLHTRTLVDEWTGRGLAAGVAGIGLAALELDALAPHPDLVALAEEMTDRLSAEEPAGAAADRVPGLFDGETGPALLLLRQYERTGDDRLLDRAVAALLSDTAVLEERSRAVLGPGFDALTGLPWLDAGGAGIALVARLLTGHREDERLHRLVERARAGTAVRLVGEAGLHRGHAGLVLLARDLAEPGEDVRDVLEAHADVIRLHSTRVGDHLTMTGRFDLRAATDLATGAAGVVLALRALDHPDVRMPLL